MKGWDRVCTGLGHYPTWMETTGSLSGENKERQVGRRMRTEVPHGDCRGRSRSRGRCGGGALSLVPWAWCQRCGGTFRLSQAACGGPRDPRKGLEPWRGCRGDKWGQNLQGPVRCKKPLTLYEPPRFTRHEAFKIIWQYGSKNHEILFICPSSFISGKLSKEFAANSGGN